MGKGSRNEGRQLTRFLSWSNPSETSLLRSLREHLLCVHSPVGGCTSFFFPSFSDFLGAISGTARHELLGGCGRGAGSSGALGFLWEDEGGARLYLGILAALGRLKAKFLLGVTVGLNNQRLGTVLQF
jgi:hypothetical protein